ncbi:MAG: glycosyltransferase family 4 protein [Actinomycetota bacterium]
MTSVAFHVDQLFFRVPGGTGTYIRELLPALAIADPSLEVRAFHARFDTPAPPALARYHPVELPRDIRTLYPRWNLIGRPPLPATLAGLDVVHTPSPAAIPPRGPGQRLVVTVHDLAFRLFPQMFPPAWRATFRLGLRRAAARADAIIAVSRHTATDLARLTKTDPGRIHVVPLAASLPWAATATDLEATLERLKVPQPYVLFVGTLEPRKNLVRLVRAYRRSMTAGLAHALVLAGPLGWRSERLQRELKVSGPGEIFLTGRLGARDLDALFRGADAFVYPSVYEGFGLPVLEAMARGVPTIVSTSSALPEVAGGAAIAVDPRSVRALSEAITRVLGDPTEAQRLSEAGLARAGRFSWERTARATIDIYTGVAS